jgi:DNA-directed RNA polymerase
LDRKRTIARNIDADERVIGDLGHGMGTVGRALLYRHVGPLGDHFRKVLENRPGRYHAGSLTQEIWDVLRGVNRDAIAAAAISGVVDSHVEREELNSQHAPREGKLRIGEAIERQARAIAIKRARKGLLPKIRRAVARKGSLQERRIEERRLLREEGITIPRWPRPLRLAVGNFAFDIMLAAIPDVILNDNGTPAISLEAAGEIDVTSALLANPVYAPTLKPPPPWISFDGADGSELVQSARDVEAIRVAIASGIPHFDAVDNLKCHPWRINRPVLQFVRQLARSRVPLLKKVKRKAGWAKLANDLATAGRFRNSTFYVDCGVDFRGRLLPRPSLNYSGPDHIRGIFKFAEEAPLGERGLWWLKVAIASAYDDYKQVGKESFDKRVAWTEDRIGVICDTARAPMSKLPWLRLAADPIQFVALAQELAGALEVGADKFIATVPIGFDASCSGLQHYSLLGRDLRGAQLTNLIPPDPDTPLDIYTKIRHRLNRALVAGAAENELAQWCLRIADRAMCKMLVMTYCYSSDEKGQRVQIYEELFDRGYQTEDIPKGAPQYLMKKTREAIEYELQGGAPAVMNYLREIARALLRCGEPVCWTSPSGLPVSNLYLEPKVETVQLHLMGKIKRHKFATSWSCEHREEKTINAISPNLVHSWTAPTSPSWPMPVRARTFRWRRSTIVSRRCPPMPIGST